MIDPDSSSAPVHVYRVQPGTLELTAFTGPTLDALSLQLPNGVYTTLRTYDRDRIVGLSAHLQRLNDSRAALQYTRSLDLTAIRSALRAVIEREGLPVARLRVTVPDAGEPIYISIEPFVTYPAAYYTHGVRCATTHLSRHTPRAKSTNFIAPSRTAKAASDPQIHELLIVNTADQILEGISSNFFAVLNAVLRTAAEDILNGITRQLILAEAQTLLPVQLTPIGLADLPQLSEAFITSASREVMPVIQIDDHVIGNGQPGPYTQTLLNRYRAHLAQTAETP
jgi:branched-chain amino acid aminotransferase